MPQSSESGSVRRHHGLARQTRRPDTPFSLCDPASPWRRGSNENTDSPLRQYFPGEPICPSTPPGAIFRRHSAEQTMTVHLPPCRLLRHRPTKLGTGGLTDATGATGPQSTESPPDVMPVVRGTPVEVWKGPFPPMQTHQRNKRRCSQVQPVRGREECLARRAKGCWWVTTEMGEVDMSEQSADAGALTPVGAELFRWTALRPPRPATARVPRVVLAPPSLIPAAPVPDSSYQPPDGCRP